MWVDGEAALLVLADIEAEEDAFNEWYDREHIRERVLGIPGYRVGRRYVATGSSPKHLALYQCHPDVFGTEQYRRMAENPDARTRHFVPLMFNSIRTRARTAARFGEAEGSVLALVSFGRRASDEARLRELCVQALLPELAAERGVFAGALLESVPEDDLPRSAVTFRRSGGKLDWLIAVESGHAELVANAVRKLQVLERLRAAGAEGPACANYRLTYRISPGP